MWLKLTASDKELKDVKEEAKDLKDAAKDLSKVVSEHLEEEKLEEAVEKKIDEKTMEKAAGVPAEWEATVKKLKKEPGIDNPFALVNWMAEKGYKPGGKDKKK